MYGNVESSQPGQGQMWGLGPGDIEACSDLYPKEENPYEPLDPPATPSSQKDTATPPATAWVTPAVPRNAGATRLCRHRGSVPTPPPPPPPAPGRCSRDRWVLGGALGVSVLLNVIFVTVGSRQLTALPEAPEAAKEAADAASSSFLLYNEAHGQCVEARGPLLTAAMCRPQAAAQRFQWLRSRQLRNWGNRRCVTATSARDLALVTLEPCREDGELQRWECGAGGLLALAGHRLHFNYGNNRERAVMLYGGDREWSRWVVHGTKDDACSRSCCPPCSRGWVHLGNSCYFFSKSASSWASAQRFCSLLGTQLLEVDTPEEKNLIRTVLESSSWLGIRDEEVEGTWKRANGSVVSRDGSSWHRNEPNGGRQENCAVVRGDGEWYDYPCASELPWVCEGPP